MCTIHVWVYEICLLPQNNHPVKYLKYAAQYLKSAVSSFFVSMLYYWGALQLVVRKIGE